MDTSKKASQEAILAQLLGSADEPEAVHNPQEEAAEMQDSPMMYEHPLWPEAVQMWMEEHDGQEPSTDGDFEGPGGVVEILNRLVDSDTGSKQAPMPPEDDPMDAENSVPDNIRKRAYKTNGGGNPDIKSAIIQKMLGGMR